jgi:hypothetical protein
MVDIRNKAIIKNVELFKKDLLETGLFDLKEKNSALRTNIYRKQTSNSFWDKVGWFFQFHYFSTIKFNMKEEKWYLEGDMCLFDNIPLNKTEDMIKLLQLLEKHVEN